MREIKFRAWDKYYKKMRYKNLILVPTKVLNDCFCDEDLIFMQYTGLKDKNGKEIYEGDIYNINGEQGEIVYIDGMFCLKPFAGKRLATPIGLYLANMRYIEIIGNIYENKELLVVKND